ncbi:MAG TPA: L,D-transpeptidase family protein, partial [Azonexus sp.]|nr:L,D-transpeptidase family protein [Azonexus sp.]
RPPAGSIPSNFLALSPRTRHAIAIDTSRSRLYLFENRPQGLQLIADYYISVGKLGVDKAAEGDQRTPLGVYYITSNLDPRTLKDFYGAGALPINYPNPLDQLRGKTGSGIWLHGTQSDTFSRPPLASDGCVVLTNQDLDAIRSNLQVGLTPVIISDSIEWLSLDDWAKEREALNQTIEAWRTDWESRDSARYLNHYSRQFSAGGQNFAQFAEQKRSVNAGKEWIKVRLDNLSVFRNPGKEELIVVTFDQDYRSNNLNNRMKKRQYWVREGGRWKIIYEGAA